MKLLSLFLVAITSASTVAVVLSARRCLAHARARRKESDYVRSLILQIRTLKTCRPIENVPILTSGTDHQEGR